MSSLTDTLRNETKMMLSKFEGISKEFKSPIDIEKQRVRIVQNFLKKYLPRSYSLGNGEIIDSDGQRTGQVDIVICNQYHPHTFSESEPGLFFSEGVVLAVEVKPDLGNYRELSRGFKQIKRIKKLFRKPLPSDIMYGSDYDKERFLRIPSIIFGFRSPELKYLIPNVRRLYGELDISLEQQVDAIIALDKGIIFNIKDSRDKINIVVKGQRILGLIGHILGIDTLQRFLFHLSLLMPNEVRFRPIIERYTGVLKLQQGSFTV